MWTDEKINEITTRVTNTALSVPAATLPMRAALIEMREEWRKSDNERLAQIRGKNEVIDELHAMYQSDIADINTALDNALMEAAALDTLNQECRKDNERLRQAVNVQHEELYRRKQALLPRFM